MTTRKTTLITFFATAIIGAFTYLFSRIGDSLKQTAKGLMKIEKGDDKDSLFI
jgi:hypothetical protein